MEARKAAVVFCLLLLGQSALPQTTSKRRNGKKDANNGAIEEMKKQINDIIQELNVLKEQQALQTVRFGKIGRGNITDTFRGTRFNAVFRSYLSMKSVLTLAQRLERIQPGGGGERSLRPEAFRTQFCLRGMKVLGKCFLADSAKKNFHSASDDCIAKGGTLATPLSTYENQQLHDYVSQSLGPEERIWIGVNDMVTEGVWVDNTGAGLRYANWETEITHQPDGATRQNCAVLSTRSKGKWFDENCREDKAFVCEFNIV